MEEILRSAEMAEGMTGLTQVLEDLVSERIIYFPIRHHSPACARHLQALLERRSPRAILIEGPASFDSLLPLLLDPETQAPFAIYTSLEEKAHSPEHTGSALVPRRAACYPFCDSSPELVALRTGRDMQSALRFIDLDYGDQVQAELLQETPTDRLASLQAEGHFQRSRYLNELAQRAGCRDHNDLWDHLFETRISPMPDEADTVRFMRDVAAWCFFARSDTPDRDLEEDGTVARERAMADAILYELEKGTESIVVVTGGFHTVALPELVRDGTSGEARDTTRSGPPCNYLIRYSFEQLDALNGYSAGMPSPLYYDLVWRRASQADALASIATELLVDLGRLSRRKRLATPLTAADEIAALDQARRLAAFRGHPGPTREDLLDGIRSCFVRGAADTEGQLMLGLARHVLCGNRIGNVPATAGHPPIVRAFLGQVKTLHLKGGDSVPHKTSLDLYRRESHRKTSRFFHALSFLGVPFARLQGGPDFLRGTGLDRIQEHWSYRWVPQTEMRLIECAILGSTIEEAAARRLFLSVSSLEQRGAGHSATEAVELLVLACRMGLHRYTGELLDLILTLINAEPSLVTLTGALQQLLLLWEAREPLEARQLAEIPLLMARAYDRACALLYRLGDTPVADAGPTLDALIRLRDLLLTGVAEMLDPDLFWKPLRNWLDDPSAQDALLRGGISALLHNAALLSEEDLIRHLEGALTAVGGIAQEQTSFLVGLLRASRDLAWKQPALIHALDRLFETWDEEVFLDRLPHLRLAFARLTPSETDRVAGRVRELIGQGPGPLHPGPVSEADMLVAARLNALVARSLRMDGLVEWIGEGDR